MILLKHLIYEHVIDVLFNQIKNNLFSRVNIKELYDQYPKNKTSYNVMTFSVHGYIYQYHNATIRKLTSDAVMLDFESAIIYSTTNDEEDAKFIDGKVDGPRFMDLDTLVEII